MYKLVVTDLDDTLLRDDKTISDLTRSVFERLRENGIKVAFATGRNWKNALSLVPLDMFDATIAQNGAVTYIGEELINAKYISPEDTLSIMKATVLHGISAVVETPNMTYSFVDLSDSLGWIRNYRIVGEDFWCEDAERILFSHRCESHSWFLENCLPPTVGYIVGRDRYAQIMHHKATKMSGILAVCDYYGLTKDEVVAFGDDTNDISMIEGCGKGIVMRNAIDIVREIADEVCDTNQNDGMARWLIDNILGEI
ncbi:MAG: HAD family hydrolase [Oscillospiraceae bacterium]|nr:HAD family hydrolase [Oscillospiraceae bacterium]